jgi:glucokinase
MTKKKEDSDYFCGIDVGGTNLRVGFVNNIGQLLHHFKEPTTLESPQALLNQIQNLLKKSDWPVSSVGIGWPGAVDVDQGIVHETPNIPGFAHYPLKKNLSEFLNLPCYIDNDAKCAGLAEKKWGAAQNYKNFILLTFGTGIGGVLFSENKIVRGSHGLAGEIGHMCLYPNGEKCNCGSLGCFERYCSAKALERKAEKIMQKFISARDILTLSRSEEWAQKIIKDFAHDLAIAIGSLTNIFDPEGFVFSGGLFTTGGEPIIDELKKNLQQQGFSSLKKNIQIVSSNLGGQAGILGAASLGMHQNY